MQKAGTEVLQKPHLGMGYPSMAEHFIGRTFDVHSALLPAYFANRHCKLVVGIVLHDGRSVYLQEPAKAPKGSNVFIFPQETAIYGKDNNFRDVALRGASEEMGLSPRDVVLHATCLTWFENRLPPSRNGGAKVTKCIVWVAMMLKPTARITLDLTEVRAMAVADSDDGYHSLTRQVERFRPAKWIGQTDPLIKAVGDGIISGEGWKPFQKLAGVQRMH